MTDLGALDYFLEISITRDATSMFLSQKKYALELYEREHMANCNPSQTLVDTESKLGFKGVLVADPTFYHSLAGGTLDFGLQLYASFTSSLVGYSDGDWAGCPATRRSTFGYYVFLGDNLLLWSSKCQHTLSRLSVEAEYQGIANVIIETTWLRNLLRKLHTPLVSTTLVYYDNVSAIYLTANPVQHQCTKHIEIGIHFGQDMITKSFVPV
ncbi:ribonuclease H-like domain-containing protein [Tanacetum coccineum]